MTSLRIHNSTLDNTAINKLATSIKVRRLRHHHQLAYYTRLMLVCLVANGLVWSLLSDWQSQQAASMMLYNFAFAILLRNAYLVNGLFKLATLSKTRLPLKLRARLGKVYHFGGAHVGAAIAGTFWLGYVLFLSDFRQLPWTVNVLLASAAALICLILICAMPKLRNAKHNLFERSHRFGGWSLLLVLIALHVHMLLLAQQPIFSNPDSYVILLVCCSIALPWLRLKKVPVHIEKHSNHAVIATFDYGVTPFAGSAMAISRSPLLEWHSFATIAKPHRSGYRLAISRAGDWTGNFIDQPPSHVWVKSIPTAGVANIEVLFHKVLYIATGSGIGPVLPHLLAKQVPCHLLWTTKAPRRTFGDDLVDEILSNEPSATIHNTDELGKPDMVPLAFAEFARCQAEVVIVISNQRLTQELVFAFEARGIPAYGAIWDS